MSLIENLKVIRLHIYDVDDTIRVADNRHWMIGNANVKMCGNSFQVRSYLSVVICRESKKRCVYCVPSIFVAVRRSTHQSIPTPPLATRALFKRRKIVVVTRHAF